MRTPHDVGQFSVPCGRCIGCRLEYSRQWAVRITHEQLMFDQDELPSSYLTLTYRPEDLPSDGQLVPEHFRDFMKRLRAKLPGRKIRYYHCGEYGEKFQRPHYHAALFGWDFPDKQFYKNVGGYPTFVSEFLDSTWTFGHCLVGSLTFESAAYVARYITKKINGEKRHGHYVNQDGVVLPQEYCTMSRMPGLGYEYFRRYWREMYPRDEVIVRGHPAKPPRYYDELLRQESPEMYERVKEARIRRAIEHAEDNTPDRLVVREKVKNAQFARLYRAFENGTESIHSV